MSYCSLRLYTDYHGFISFFVLQAAATLTGMPLPLARTYPASDRFDDLPDFV